MIEDERFIPETDYCVATMSLPRGFGTEMETIPRAPYLKVPGMQYPIPTRNVPLRVGLCWAGSADHQHDSLRSIPLAAFSPLFNLPDVVFYSLQVGPGEMDLIGAGFPIVNLDARPVDYFDTATILTELDLLISADTSVVHLAGAIGLPVWMLTPFAPDWRWLLEREDSPWYPSLRLFRRAADGDWGPVVDRVRERLAGMARPP